MLHQAISATDQEAPARSYTVSYEDFRTRFPNAAHHGLCWALRMYGPGHWCIPSADPSLFANGVDAHTAGRRWVETGRVS